MSTNESMPATVTPEDLRHAFAYNPDTGAITWRNPTPGSVAIAGQIVGSGSGYKKLSLKGVSIWAHRAAWAIHHGSFPVGVIDHINHDKSDNRLCNLRDVGVAENTWNASKKSAFAGVRFNSRNTWTAVIRHRGVRHYLGCFKSKEEAADAYQKAAIQLRGDIHG